VLARRFLPFPDPKAPIIKQGRTLNPINAPGGYRLGYLEKIEKLRGFYANYRFVFNRLFHAII
tara:strand:- start:760 stop:948 length:189 start_codon:yes stop_codon:yes gene_type:complete